MKNLLVLCALLCVVFGQTPAPTNGVNCSRAIDMVFVLDDSGSIATSDFTRMKNFVYNYADTFTFGPANAAMGSVLFGTTARVQTPLTQNKATFLSGVTAMSPLRQNTCISCGMRLGNAQFGANTRGATRVEIVLTDGVQNVATYSIAGEAAAADALGIVRVAIGVGSGTNAATLNSIASTVNGNKLVFVTDWDSLAGIINSLVQTVCEEIPPTPPPQVCGDGVVEGTEQCDGGACCTDNCTLSTATTVCRPAAGECDVAETCSGTVAACPADAFKAAGTPCGEFFGLCDVRLEKTCLGNTAQCYGPPAPPAGPLSPFSWDDFNVISFDGFKCHGGDVEGRLAAKNSVDLAGFSLGLELRKAVDGDASHTLLVGGDAKWTDGSLYPIGTPSNDWNGEALIGGTFTAPQYLLDREVDIDSVSTKAAFDNAQSYFTTLQNTLAALGENVAYSVQYTNGLHLVCTATADVYHVKITATDFNKIDWVVLTGCKFTARWIVDITGTENVVIKGQPFPAIVERVIYNVLGSGRTITGTNGVAGHILAPRNSYFQTGGVTYGKVIVGNVIEARQNNKPNCKNFNPVVLSTAVLRPVQLGDTLIVVVDLANFVAGDLVCIAGNCQKLQAAAVYDIDGDGVDDHVFSFATGITSNLAANSILTAEVDPNNSDNRNGQYSTVPLPNPEAASAATLGAILFALVLAFLL